MGDGWWIAAAIVAFVVIWAIAKVVQFDRKSREDWRKVDRSKLREWDEDW